jgi:hypothetical protein
MFRMEVTMPRITDPRTLIGTSMPVRDMVVQ